MGSFSAEVLDAAAREREVALTTHGRKTGNPHRTVLWVWGDGGRLFVRSGGGLGRDWPRNLLAQPDGVLHLREHDVAVHARHLDTGEARSVSPLVARKYGSVVRLPEDGAPPTPAEHATFELTPAGR
ncbi:MAG TPA: nitroreductase family deazaflavin-dependent oxidoreductase [Terriglobales bacterium]|nr:nitroreductase family deazaflavin-dependent oxidoreductase [Terriglobales bacterium]